VTVFPNDPPLDNDLVIFVISFGSSIHLDLFSTRMMMAMTMVTRLSIYFPFNTNFFSFSSAEFAAVVLSINLTKFTSINFAILAPVLFSINLSELAHVLLSELAAVVLSIDFAEFATLIDSIIIAKFSPIF
jgi:hypothetical protein